MGKVPILQLELFCQRPQTPSWRILPTEVRRKTVVLLAKILRSDREALRDDAPGKEARDE
jgi:hypothetical protein